MRTRRLVAAVAVISSLSLGLAACGSSPADDEDTNTDNKTSLVVGWNQPFYSFNSCTTNGNAVANTNPLYLTNAGFWYYNPALELVRDESFGSYEKVSDSPLTVKYTVADGAKWSDGTPVTAADMLLWWAAGSGKFNTIAPDKVEYDEETGKLKFPAGSVFFDTSSAGMALVTDTPVIGDDGKSLTLVYSEPYADWELDMTCLQAAHVVAKHAGLADADALVAAVEGNDTAALGPVSEFWSTGYDYTDMPTGDNADVAVGNGAYVVTDLKANEFMSFAKNPEYTGDLEANIDELTIRWNEDPVSQLQSLQNGEIAMMAPQMTEDVATQAAGIDNVASIGFSEGTYEHMDLVFDNGGPFSAEGNGGDAATALAVRKAYLTALPRQQVIDKLIKPINPDAEIRNSFTNTPASPNYDLIADGNGMSAYNGSVDDAKAILADAGVQTPIDVKVMYAEGNVRREAEFQIYKSEMAKAGFNLIDKKNVDWGSKLGDKSYDAVFFGWASSSTAVSADYETYGTGRINNLIGYSNPEVDKILLEINKTTDPAALGALQLEAEKILVADAIGATIFQFPGAVIYNTDAVSGVADPVLSLVPTMFYGFWDWEALG